MKKLNMLWLLVVCLSISSVTQAKGSWEMVKGSIPSQHQQAIFPRNYKAFYLNQNDMKEALSKASLSPGNPIFIDLPDPENNYHTFRVWETPVITPEMQVNYPNLKTYTGVEINNETVTTKISLTDLGFRAMVYSPDNDYFIAPYAQKGDGYYLVFNQRDYTGSGFSKGTCGVTTEAQMTNGHAANVDNQPSANHVSGTAKRSNGDIKHYYRVGIACTGEWAQSVCAGLSTAQIVQYMAATVNNMNGVFERELSVSMILIPEEDQLINLDPNTDPYTADGPNDALLPQNQPFFDSKFPTGTEYDIGHVFNTAGGGIAQVGCICQDGSKASGVSSCYSPEDIHVVVHEMGHQMGSTHTFNSEQGGCSGQGSAESAYETGSGTTIMSYNGLCDADNVPGFSFDYYHVYTLDVITSNLSSLSCGVDSPGSVAISIPDMNDEFYIPKNTAFELICGPDSASENNPSVTFCWEQWDTGHFQELEADCAAWDSGPIMQSFPPVVSHTRTFPLMDVLIAGNYQVLGQRLPTVARDMHYRVTARSYKNGWGTFKTSDPTLIHVADKAPFRVLTPSDTSTWDVGSQKTITWDPGGSQDDPINCGFVDIHISYDGGKTFPNEVVNDAPNNGSYTLTVPDLYSDSVRFKVKGEGNIFFDISKANIKIHGNPILGTNDLLKEGQFLLYPNPAKNTISLENKSGYQGELQLCLVNVLGQNVWTGSMNAKTDIDVSSLARGNYFLHITNTKSGKGVVKKVSLQ